MLGAAARWPLLLVAISATLGAAKGDVGELEEEKLVEDEEVGDHGREICYNTDDQMDPILFFFFVLLVGAVILLGLARLPQHWPRPPYTAILFVIGMGMGGLADYDHLGKLGHATKGMTNMDPHLILYAFLPPLLFESAFSMSHHVFVKCLPQALVLALPGVLIATGLTGTIVRWIFVEYDWSWTLAMVFGAIVSATDPVAVVALLVELSAPKPLSTVIEAESLLNDGSAFVVFLLLLSFAAGDEKSVGEVVTTIVKLAVVGPLLGLAFGIGFNECLLRFCNNDPTIEISLLIIAAYICFWTAETTETEASGVLAVVTLGLYMGGPGKHTISPEIHHEMHHVWSFLGHAANTVLFVLSGSFSYFLVNSPTITATDWGYLLATYFVIHFTRGVTILVLWPALQSLGYGMSVPRGIILWYAGLRGAVGLVLALLVSHEEGISPENRTRIQFLVAGLVALTIGINGTTAGLLYKKLGLSESTKGYKATLKLSVDHVEKTTDKLAAEMKSFQFWGSLVQKDLTEEVRKLVEYRPHSAHGTEPAEEFCTDNERLKRKVVAWFGTQPEHAGRRIARVTYIREIGKMQFDAHYRHIVDYGWPPPLTGVGGATDLDAREECMRFTLDKAGNDVVSVGKGNRLEESKLYFTEGKVNKQAFHWYPDFSPVVASTPPSFLQRIFAKRQRQNHNRTLLSDIREDLRRIIIVSVQHRYDEWNERRIIKPDVHGILEEATLFVEDEDHMWVSQMEDMWEFRGRYDLKSEFIRVLEAIGLHEHGSLCIALRGMAATVEHEPYGEDATPSLTQKYWASRNDYLGRLLALLNRLAGKFMDSDGFTNAYLHNKLRLAVSCLMFYRAAHEEVGRGELGEEGGRD
ncbi:Sodium/hydrogen exchanger 7 [Diplonema papillatum]|nr:Sodium/hydrogen exchanger 7 [Diplonema papillatum]